MSIVGLQGKVARFVDERRVAVNLGQRDGVVPGTKFAILAETPVEIVDPDSQEVLGVADQEKVRVQAIEVQERFSICSRYEKWGVLVDPFNALSDLRRLARVRIEEDTSQLPPDERYVKVGD